MVTGLYKTKNQFSATLIDQAHEQNSVLVKWSGGAIGLLHNHIILRKWLLAGQEQAWLIKEFKEQFLESKDNDDHFHHKENLTQNTFRMKVNSSVEAFEDMGNPFLEDLSTLDIGIVMERSAVDSFTIDAVGREQVCVG